MQEQRRFLSGCRSSMERRCASAIEGAKAARSPCEKDVVTRDKFAGWQGIMRRSIRSLKGTVGRGGICCGLDDPIFRLVSFLFSGNFVTITAGMCAGIDADTAHFSYSAGEAYRADHMTHRGIRPCSWSAAEFR